MISQPLPTSERKRSRGSPAGTPKPRLRKILCAAIAGASLLVGACAAPLKTESKQPLAGGPGPDEAPKAAATAIASDRDELDWAKTAVPPESVASPPAQPQQQPQRSLPGEMTVEEALQHAVDHHPRLKALFHEVGVARAKLIAAGLLTNPQLVVDYETPATEPDVSQVTGRLMFTIPTADKLRLGKSVAYAEILRAKYALSRETRLVIQEAGDLAVDVLYYQELLDLQTRMGEMATKQAALQQSRFEAQQIPFPDAIQASVYAKDIEFRRLDTAAQLDTARVRLSAAIGMSPPGLGRLNGHLGANRLPPLPLETLVALTERNSPGIGEAQAELLRSQRELALARAEAVPDLQIGPRSQTSLGGEDRRQALGGRIAVDLPMFNRNQGGICESAAQVQVDRARLEEAELTASSDAAAIYEGLRSLQARLQYCESQMLPLADRTEAVIRENEVTKAVPPIQISSLLLKLIDIRVDYLALRYRYEKLYRQLENHLGCRLVELQAKIDPSPTPNRP